ARRGRGAQQALERLARPGPGRRRHILRAQRVEPGLLVQGAGAFVVEVEDRAHRPRAPPRQLLRVLTSVIDWVRSRRSLAGPEGTGARTSICTGLPLRSVRYSPVAPIT